MRILFTIAKNRGRVNAVPEGNDFLSTPGTFLILSRYRRGRTKTGAHGRRLGPTPIPFRKSPPLIGAVFRIREAAPSAKHKFYARPLIPKPTRKSIGAPRSNSLRHRSLALMPLRVQESKIAFHLLHTIVHTNNSQDSAFPTFDTPARSILSDTLNSVAPLEIASCRMRQYAFQADRREPLQRTSLSTASAIN